MRSIFNMIMVTVYGVLLFLTAYPVSRLVGFQASQESDPEKPDSEAN